MNCRCKPTRRSSMKWLRENLLVLATVMAVILGVAIGLALHYHKPGDDGIAWIKLWGELFLRMLNLIILPLILSCIIVSLARIEGRASGRMGLVIVVYLVANTLFSSALGLLLTYAIQPGREMGGERGAEETASNSYTDIFMDIIRNLLPANMVRATLENSYTRRHEIPDMRDSTRWFNGSYIGHPNATRTETEVLYRDGMNVLGIVVISIAIGIGIHASEDRGKPLLKVFEALNAVIFKILNAIFWYSPVGIMSLIAGAIIEVDDIGAALRSVGLFVVTHLVGHVIYQVAVAPVFMLVLLRTNPFRFYLAYLDGIVAGSASATGAASLPFLIRDGQEKLGIDERIVDFAQPILSIIGRVGSALFICSAAMFITQSYGQGLGLGQCLLLIVLVTVLSGAVAAVPSASVMVLITVCNAASIPLSDRIGLIMMVEWFNDRVRASTNVMCNAYGTVLVNHFCRKYLGDKMADGEQDPIAGAKQTTNNTIDGSTTV